MEQKTLPTSLRMTALERVTALWGISNPEMRTTREGGSTKAESFDTLDFHRSLPSVIELRHFSVPWDSRNSDPDNLRNLSQSVYVLLSVI
jgi:hypothetical protein